MALARRRITAAAAVAIALVVAGTSSPGLRTEPPADSVLAAELPAPEPSPAEAPSADVAGPTPVTSSLSGVLAEAGYLGPGTSVYVAEVVPGGGYVTHEAGGGGHDSTLWPASSVKVLAAEGALAYLATHGFTGAALVSTDEWSATVTDLYDEAIRYSSNDAYDHLVEIAGVDWLNEVFLTPANGFADTVIQRSYAYGHVITSPPMTLSEGERTVDLPERTPVVEQGVPEGGNRSNLAEMVESVRRVVLDAELPEGDRLGLAPDDVAAIADALLGAEGFLEAGVADALGADAYVYNKPGWVLGESCLDVGLVVDPAHDHRFLVGIAGPDDGTECAAVPAIAAAVLSSLAGAP